MIEINTPPQPEGEEPTTPEPKRAPLFTIDGTEYSYQTEFPPNEGLTYLRILNSRGMMAALDWAMLTSLQPEGYKALRDCKHLSQDQLNEIMVAVIKPLLGTVEVPKA